MVKSKKVLLVSNTAWSIFNFRLVLAQFISKNNCVTIAAAPPDDYSSKLEQAGVEFLPVSMDNKGSNPVRDLFLLIRLFFLYLKHQPDLIIHYTIKPNIYGSVAAKLLGKKSVAVVTGLGYAFIKRGFTTNLVMVMYRLAFKCSNRVLFLNETDRTLFCRLKIVAREKTLVIPGEGINTGLFKPQPTSFSEDVTFLFIGRLLYDKGLFELVNAMRMLKKVKPSAKLQLIGFLDALNPTAVSRDELNSWISEGVVEFLGAHSDVRPFIARANCLVLPSYREGISRTLLEAASMAKPIIATDVVGCREIVKDHVSGFLCKPKDAESLYSCMLKFANSDKLQQEEMGRAGRKLIVENFSDQKVLEAFTPVLNSNLGIAFKQIDSSNNARLKISVITVVYDNRHFVKDAIESVVNQSYPDIQYIVIDGGSTDGSLDIIRSYGHRIEIVVSEPDKGIYDAMNKGLALATGDVVGFLNADDFYASTRVIEQIADSFVSSGYDALYANLDYVSRTDKSKIIRKWRSGEFDRSKFLKGWMPPHPTFFVKRKFYQELGGYNQALNSAADYELMLRFLYKNRLNFYFLNKVIVKMRVGGQSNRTFRNRILANIQDRQAWVINGIRPRWYTLIMKPVSKIFQYLK